MLLCDVETHVYLCLHRGEEDESLAIKPPQQIARKDKSHHRKEEKRKDKRRHRSHSAEGGMASGYIPCAVGSLCLVSLKGITFNSRKTCSTQRQRKGARKWPQEAAMGRRQSQEGLGEAEATGAGESSFTPRKVSADSAKFFRFICS